MEKLGLNNVAIISCVNSEFLEEIKALAEKKRIKLIQSSEDAVKDYINNINSEGKTAEMLRDEKNRNLAFNTAKDIYYHLSGGKDIGKSERIYFTKAQLVKGTNLTWSKAEEVLNMLSVFGLAKRDKGRFQLVFKDKDVRDETLLDVSRSVANLNLNIARYIIAVDKSADLTESDKKRMKGELEDIHKDITV